MLHSINSSVLLKYNIHVCNHSKPLCCHTLRPSQRIISLADMTSRCVPDAMCFVADLAVSVFTSDPQSMSHPLLLYRVRCWSKTKITLEYCFLMHLPKIKVMTCTAHCSRLSHQTDLLIKLVGMK